jgi:hypothetical protein
MKISELVSELMSLQTAHGDLNVIMVAEGVGVTIHRVTYRDFKQEAIEDRAYIERNREHWGERVYKEALSHVDDAVTAEPDGACDLE